MKRLHPIVVLALVAACATGEEPGGAQDEAPRPFVALTFNTGSGASVLDDSADFGPTQSDQGDEHYGNGLAWDDAITRTAAFLADLEPDLIGFQEIFHAPECDEVPTEAHAGFICERWQAGEPTVLEEVVSDAYQLACHVGTPDECIAVHERFGRIRGCDDRFCLEGVLGGPVGEDCSSKTRVGRVTLDLTDGGELTVVHVHANSGGTPEDDACREVEIDQIFVDQGDGQPAARGERNLILGDFNSDPWRFEGVLGSADRWNQYVEDEGYRFLLGDDGEGWATYGGLIQIDHLVGDAFEPVSCQTAGEHGPEPLTPVLPYVHFDHQPVWCTLAWQAR